MKKLFTLLYMLISFSAKADYWTQKVSFPGVGTDAAFSFAVGNKGYVGCGDDYLGGNLTNTFWEYNPFTNVWTQKANFGGAPRVFAVGFSILNKGYAGLGGTNITAFSDFWEYDPGNNTWSQKASFTGIREGAISFSLGAKGYVGLGQINPVVYNDLWEYDPSINTWSQKTNFPGLPRTYGSGLTIGNKCYTGMGNNGATGAYHDFWEYNPSTDTWSQMADFGGVPCIDMAAFSICDKGYFGTGEINFSVYTNQFWQYNPITNQWIQKTNFPGISRDETSFFSIGNKGYVGMGSQTISLSDFWEYTPDSACATGIEEFQISNFDFQISPNPAKDFIIINYSFNGKEKINLTITDAEGKIVHQSPLTPKGEPQIKISVEDLSAGIYFVEMNNGKQKAVKKFIKE